MNSNEEIVQKAITVGADAGSGQPGNLETGGRLSPTQQDAFVTLVKDNSRMLRAVRFVQMPAARHRIDRMWIGEPVTRGATEVTNTPVDGQPKFNQIALDAEKLRSDWSISTETIQENIEGADFEDKLMAAMSKRISTDVELLAIQGDDSVAATGTPWANLIGTMNGWDVLTDSAHIVDAGGGGISRSLLATALRRMPDQYLQDEDLRWIMSRSMAIDWLEGVSGRETSGGDAALNGTAPISPLGIPALIVPNIPSTVPLALATGETPAILVSEEYGPYQVEAGGADQISFDETTTFNGVALTAASGDEVLTLNPGVYSTVEIAAEIRRALAVSGSASALAILANIQFLDDGQGRLVFQTVGGGVNDSIALNDIAAGRNFADLELGLVDTDGDRFADTNPLVDAGHATATGGTVNEGTFMWLANPKNFIIGMVDETRLYSEFDKDTDCVESVVYNHVAFNVENLEAIVKVTGIRKGTVGTI